MATTITYNGVTMQNVLTRRFDEEAVRDDSDTDVIYHKFGIRVMGTVHSVEGVTFGVSPSAAISATANMILVRQLLMEHRKDFTMTVDGETLLKANAVNLGTSSAQNFFFDVNNGPKPRRCNVTLIAGSNIYRVEYEIEISLIDCTVNANTQGVLNNRWSMSDLIDKDWYTTRTMRGRLRLANSTLNPQSFRAWCIPPLQPNFKREVIDVVSSPDQLILEYTVVDRQVYAAAPLPATSWSGTHIVSTADGVNSVGEIQISVTGPPEVAKADLIDLAATICVAKLKLTTEKNVLQQAAIIDHLEENTVEVRCEVLLDPGNSEYSLLPLPAETVGLPLDPADFPNYDPTISPAMPLYGQATPAGLLIAALQSPCNDMHAVGGQANLQSRGSASGSPSGTKVTASTRELNDDPAKEDNYAAEDAEAIYTYYKIKTTYGVPQGIVQAPLSSSGSGTDTCAFLQISLATCWRVVQVEAERVGAAPKFPLPTGALIGTVKVVVLDYKISPEAPKLTADGVNKRYRATAEYTYGLSRPPTGTEDLLVGSLPWMNSSVAADVFPATAYSLSIVT